MVNRDVIVSALACGGKMSCSKQAAKFENPPVVININSSTGVSTGGGTVQGFRKAAAQYKKLGEGSVLQGVFNTQKNLEPNRIALVSYLDGWSFIHEILKTEDASRIDTLIILDGINTRNLDPWFKYLDGYCLNATSKLWLACSHAPHKTAKSSGVGIRLSLHYRTATKESWHVPLPEYILNADLGKSVSIYSKDENPKTKIFHEDTLRERLNILSPSGGGFSFLGYEGNSRQDQTYVQQYVQPRLWQRLREQWKDPTIGVVW